jgi:hypothetical protein
MIKWSDRLALDVALCLEGSGETLDTIALEHGIKKTELVRFSRDIAFQKKIEELRASIKDKGLTFRLKARTQAEELLLTSWSLIHSPNTSPAVKADLIKSTVKWAGLEPRSDENMNGSSPGGVVINIDLGGQSLPIRIIDESGIGK